MIADKFNINVWHDMHSVFSLKHFEVIDREETVFLKLKRDITKKEDEYFK